MKTQRSVFIAGNTILCLWVQNCFPFKIFEKGQKACCGYGFRTERGGPSSAKRVRLRLRRLSKILKGDPAKGWIPRQRPQLLSRRLRTSPWPSFWSCQARIEPNLRWWRKVSRGRPLASLRRPPKPSPWPILKKRENNPISCKNWWRSYTI